MIDDKKIEEAARYYCNNRYPASQDTPFIAEGFRYDAKWAINEFLKDLLHPASEVPRNDNGNILALSDSETKLYNMNELMDKTNCTTYNEMWEQEVKKYHFKCWLFVKEFIESVMKGGKK